MSAVTAGPDPKQQWPPITPSSLRTTSSRYVVSRSKGQGSLHASDGNSAVSPPWSSVRSSTTSEIRSLGVGTT
jgi:hypothetical protein